MKLTVCAGTQYLHPRRARALASERKGPARERAIARARTHAHDPMTAVFRSALSFFQRSSTVLPSQKLRYVKNTVPKIGFQKTCARARRRAV